MRKELNRQYTRPFEPICILLVDAHETFRHIVRQILIEQYPNRVAQVGDASSRLEALALARALQPQLILVDMDFPEREGLVVIQQLRNRFPDAVILAMTLQDPVVLPQCNDLASSYGADEVILKQSLIADLGAALERQQQKSPRTATKSMLWQSSGESADRTT